MSHLRVLFFSLWYPHRYDAMDGLFVRKHAEAVGRLADVEVLYLHSDGNIRKFEIVENQQNGIREVTVYFPKFGPPVIRQLVVAINFWRAFKRGYKLVQKPDISHINVLGREGLCALWLKKRFGIPYVAIEHWSRYMPTSFSYRGFFTKKLTELVARHASVLMPVSRPLGENMKRLGIKCARYQIINNVVDDFFFATQKSEKREKKRFVSVTCFSNKSKNLTGLLNAVKQLSLLRQDFELVMVGSGVDYQMVYNHYLSLGFADGMVKFVGEQTPEGVCKWLNNSDFLVLFSNYETYSCVVSEAICCGKPIVSSALDTITSRIPDYAGLFVQPRNESELNEALNKMLDTFSDYDTEAVRSLSKQCSYAAVGQKLIDVYMNVLNVS